MGYQGQCATGLPLDPRPRRVITKPPSVILQRFVFPDFSFSTTNVGELPNYFGSSSYPELLRDRRCRLVVFGIEVGGRWSDEAATFLRLLAHTKARQAPALLRHSLTNALIHRWSAMLTHAAMHAFAASLLDQDLSGCHNLDGNTPSISEILAEVTSPPHYSRLPALL